MHKPAVRRGLLRGENQAMTFGRRGVIYDRQWQMVGLAASFWCITVGIAMMTLWLVEPVDIAEQFRSRYVS